MKPSILFVDDEPNILKSLRRLLRAEPYEVRVTSDPVEAVRLVKDSPPAVLVSDQRMPVMTGVEVLEQVRIHAEDTVRILLTGYADMTAAVEAVNRGGIYSYLTKPWDEQGLKAVLRGAVEHHMLRRENERLKALTLEQNLELKALNTGLEARVAERTQEVQRLNTDLQASFLGGVRLLAQLSETQSRVVGSHSKRVAAHSLELGKALGMSPQQLETLEVAATLHDLGKMWGGPADDRGKHAEYGASLMTMIPNLREASVLVRHHHERFDGGGLPDRLVGEEIPFGSRVISVADVYDVILNGSSRFATTTPEGAALELRVIAKGGALDPEIVETFIELVVGKAVDEGSEIELRAHDLKIGMVLSRDVLSQSGAKLLPEGTPIGSRQLVRLQNHLDGTPLAGVFVYRNRQSG